MTLDEVVTRLEEIHADLDEKHFVTNKNKGDIDYRLTAALSIGLAGDAARKLLILRDEVVKLASDSGEPPCES
jgi:hypothetical protein